MAGTGLRAMLRAMDRNPEPEMSPWTRAVAKALHAELCGCEQVAHVSAYRIPARAAICAYHAAAKLAGEQA